MDINLLDYTSLINTITYKFPHYYRNDLMNEGYLAIMDAHKNYNPDKGEFEVYIKKWIYYAMLKFVSVDNITDSLDATIIDGEGETTTLKDMIGDEIDYEEMWSNTDYYDKHMANLSQIDRFIKRKYYVDGMSVENIIKLYSQWHHITNKNTIYIILNK